MDPGFVAALRERCATLGPFDEPFEAAVAHLDASTCARVIGCVTIGSVPLGAATLARLPALRWVGCFGSGYEGVDLAAARSRGVQVTHSRAANADSVADLALGLLIASVRGLHAGRLRLDSGGWQGNTAERNVPVRGLTGRHVGVYGLGAIGERIARRAEAFGMVVGYHNRHARADVAYPYFSTLLDLARWADVLVVAVRADAGNRHAVDAEVLAALGADGHVVNIARGAVIDEAALVAALESGAIAGAGLDVFEHEPRIPAALLALPNVALTPHIGGATLQAREAMERAVLANLDALLAGRALPTPVPA